METKIERQNNKATLTIEVPPERMERYKRRAAKDLSASVNIKGFRLGAAPYEVISRTVGEGRILEEAAEIAVREEYVQALVDNDIESVGQPTIEVKKLADGNPFVFTATTAVLPEVKIGDYTSVKIEKVVPEVSDEEVEKALATLQKSRASYRHVARPAQKGDRVEVDFESSTAEGAVEGGTSRQHPLVIGEGHFMPGFEDNLVGMNEGDNKKFSLTAPAEYYHEKLAGKDVSFSVTMKNIQEVEPPDLNDAFASRLGKFGSLDDLKQSIKEGLLEEKEEREKEKRRIEIIEKLIERSTIDVPEIMIDEELGKMEREFDLSISRMGLSKDDYLAHLNLNMDSMKVRWREQAEKRVKAALILREVARKESIFIDEKEVDERTERMLQSLTSPKEAEELDMKALKDHARASLKNEKTFERLEELVIK